MILGSSSLSLFSHRPRFPSLVSLSLHLCRRLRLLRNDRTSLLPHEDALAKAVRALRRRSAEENEHHDGELEVSDVLDVIRIVRENRRKKGEGRRQQRDVAHLAASDYEVDLKSGNLMDAHGLCDVVRVEAASISELLRRRASCVLFLGPTDLDEGSAERELFDLLFPGSGLAQVFLETPLDSSLNESSSSLPPRVTLQPLTSIPSVPPPLTTSATLTYCRDLAAGYLRLLLNSR